MIFETVEGLREAFEYENVRREISRRQALQEAILDCIRSERPVWIPNELLHARAFAGIRLS